MKSIAFVLAAALSLIASGSANAKTVALASSVPNSGTNKIFVDTFKKGVETRIPEYKVDVFLDSQLGGERDLIDLVKIGEIQFFIGSIHPSQYYPELDASAVPYLFQDWASVKKFLKGPIGLKMSEALQERGNAVPVAYYYQGARWATTRGRSFSTVAELKGIKLRMSEIPLWIDIWSGLGATIAPMPSKEVFSAMQTGVIDAQENMLANIWGRRIHEVSDYLIATQHQQSFMTLMANKDFWDDLSDAQKADILEAGENAATITDAETTNVVKKIVADIQASGVELVVPDPSFKKDALPVIERVAKKYLAPGVWEEALKACCSTGGSK